MNQKVRRAYFFLVCFISKEFISDIEPYTSSLPVVTGELADTWIFGIGSDPVKTATHRIMQRQTSQCIRQVSIIFCVLEKQKNPKLFFCFSIGFHFRTTKLQIFLNFLNLVITDYYKDYGNEEFRLAKNLLKL